MRKARAGFLVAALVAASMTTLCLGLAFAQPLPAPTAASPSAPEGDAPQSAQEPADHDVHWPAQAEAKKPRPAKTQARNHKFAGRAEKRKERVAHASKDQRRAEHAHRHKLTHTSADRQNKKRRNTANNT
jgi:hypothetical protein